MLNNNYINYIVDVMFAWHQSFSVQVKLDIIRDMVHLTVLCKSCEKVFVMLLKNLDNCDILLSALMIIPIYFLITNHRLTLQQKGKVH